MHKYEGYDSFMATYINGDYPNLKYTPGLRIEEVPNISGNWENDSCTWLKANAKRIDVLNLYHLCPRSWRHILTYKLANPKGKVYLKLDSAAVPSRFKRWRNIKSHLQLFVSNFVSTEFEENASIISRKWHHKIGYIPNPFNPNELHDFRPFSERTNTILYVGRIEHEKGSHTLLEAFAKINGEILGWRLQLVGSITEEEIASYFYAERPELRERVIFTGEIRDRAQLTEMYRDAKVFAFPSRHESFGIALTEAMMQGCFAVTTDIPSSRVLTEGFRYALSSKVDDVDGLAKNLLYACTHETEIESLASEGMEATRIRCDLKHCCDVIVEGLR